MTNRPAKNRLSKEQWKERIRPHLSSSIQEISDAITNQAALQSWLHEASFEAADGLGKMHAMQAEAMGHMRMMDDLESTFPELVDAVDELTSGFGTLDLQWRPLTPNFSRLRISFSPDYEVNVFVRLGGTSPSDAVEVIETLRAALPKGEPFPNRPNERTALAVLGDTSLGVRLSEHAAAEGNRRQTVTLLPPGAKPAENLSPPQAVDGIARYFTAETGGE